MALPATMAPPTSDEIQTGCASSSPPATRATAASSRTTAASRTRGTSSACRGSGSTPSTGSRCRSCPRACWRRSPTGGADGRARTPAPARRDSADSEARRGRRRRAAETAAATGGWTASMVASVASSTMPIGGVEVPPSQTIQAAMAPSGSVHSQAIGWGRSRCPARCGDRNTSNTETAWRRGRWRGPRHNAAPASRRRRTGSPPAAPRELLMP